MADPKFVSNLRGTHCEAFKVGKADFNAEELTEKRELALPDANGTLMVLEQKYANLLALGLAVILAPGENIPPKTLVTVDGNAQDGWTATIAGTSPANGYAPDGIALEDFGVIVFAGIHPLRVPGSSYAAGENMYLYTSGRADTTPGGKGTVGQFVGIAAGAMYNDGTDAVVPVSLEFGEASF